MHFLQSIWLAAMAGIILPVIVHFWNDRRGKVLRIGSITLLEGASQRLSWSRRLSQWWLLLVRCLLVMALALLLAGPYWQGQDAGKKKGWVLADAGVPGAPARVIDSLVAAGWDRHVLEGTDYWQAFKAADRMAPAGVEFYVVTSGLAGRFAGVRPVTNRVVNWDIYSPEDSSGQWVQKAWNISPDSVRIMTGVAKQTGSIYHYQTVVKQTGMKVDTTTLRLTIYTDAGYQQDGRYLAAAIKAVQQFTHRRMQVQVTGSVPSGPVDGWLFWLSSHPLPASVADTSALIWRYAAGPEKKTDTWMEGVELYKEITEASDSAIVWRDGYGRGVLVREGRTFHFYSRLNPEWGALVWSRRFPELMARLLFGEEGPGGSDRRMIDVTQAAPVRQDARVDGDSGGHYAAESGHAAGAPPATADGPGALDLGPASWILLFTLFILERWLSGRE